MCRCFEIDVAHNFNMGIEIPSQTRALFGSSEQIGIIIIVSMSMLKSESIVTVSKI